MTLNTRDCAAKGERDLTYMMLKVWYDYKPEIAFYIFETIMLNTELKEPLGSWKDIKYLCNYLRLIDRRVVFAILVVPMRFD